MRVVLLCCGTLLLGACNEPAPAPRDRTPAPTAPIAAPQPSPTAPPPVEMTPIAPLVPAPAPQPAAPLPPPSVEIAGSSGQPARTIANNGLLPLARILAIAQRRVPGDVVEVDLDDDDGRPEYELEILTADGRSIEIKIDARTGTILEVEED